MVLNYICQFYRGVLEDFLKVQQDAMETIDPDIQYYFFSPHLFTWEIKWINSETIETHTLILLVKLSNSVPVTKSICQNRWKNITNRIQNISTFWQAIVI